MFNDNNHDKRVPLAIIPEDKVLGDTKIVEFEKTKIGEFEN